MGFECIRFETGEGIARIFFNRSERLNAFNRQMLKELRTVLDKCAEDPQVRVILIRSRKQQCDAADTPGPQSSCRNSPRRLGWWFRTSHLMFRGVAPSPCFHIYRGRSPPGNSQQGAKRAQLVASSCARSHWEHAV